MLDIPVCNDLLSAHFPGSFMVWPSRVPGMEGITDNFPSHALFSPPWGGHCLCILSSPFSQVNSGAVSVYLCVFCIWREYLVHCGCCFHCCQVWLWFRHLYGTIKVILSLGRAVGRAAGMEIRVWWGIQEDSVHKCIHFWTHFGALL